MKQTKKNSLTRRLAKLGYVAPAAFVLSLSALSLNAVAEEKEKEKDASDLSTAFSSDTIGVNGSSLTAFYLASRDSTRGLLSADFLKALDGDLFIQANGLKKQLRFDSQLKKSDTAQGNAILGSKSWGIVLGTNLTTLSTDGTNKLAFGAFGGYGQADFSAFADASTAVGDIEGSDGKAASAPFAKTIAADLKGFGGGLFFAFKADADAKTGLFANGSISLDKFDHNFSRFNEKAGEKKDASGAITEERKPDFEEFAAIAPKTIRGELAVGFVAQLPEIGGCALFATPNAKIRISRSVGLKGLADEKVDDVGYIKDIQGGLKLSAGLLDGALEPFISVDGLFSDGIASDVATASSVLAAKLTGGLKYTLSDNFVLSAEAGLTKQIGEKPKTGEAQPALRESGWLGDLSAKLGLSYLF